MKTLPLIGFLLLSLGLAGCGNTATNATRLVNSDFEATGWPFRWTTQNVEGGWTSQLKLLDIPNGPTKADAVLTKDTLALIAKSEAAAGRPAPEIDAIKPLKDSREVWVLKSAKDGLAYVVGFKPSPNGGIDIKTQGPQLYSR